MKLFSRLGFLFALLILPLISIAQQVPHGINYQAVARDVSGDELANRSIDIKFSVHSGTPLGNLEYQELHSDIATTKYGVFTVTIGNGTPIAGSRELFSDINWESGDHFLKVEIKFASAFIEMGTIKFLSVPYALYAGKSLEAGPEGPQGPPGDPATDNQRLNFDGVNLWIDDGEATPTIISTINLAALLNVDDDDANPTNEIQDLRIVDNKLKITNNTEATEIDLSHFLMDSDIDPANEIQDLSLAGNILTITKNGTATQIDLSVYLDNTDSQQLSFDSNSNTLSITNGNSVNLGGSVAFRARKNLSDGGLNFLADYDFIANNIEYNSGLGYNNSTGVFTAPLPGIYSFNVGYYANGSGDSRKLYIFVDGSLYETLQTGIGGGVSLHKSIMIKLTLGQTVCIKFNTGTSSESGTGTFSGFRVY
jgi:hypothetical protein